MILLEVSILRYEWDISIILKAGSDPPKENLEDWYNLYRT